MMLDFWWKVFLSSIVIAVLFKIFGLAVSGMFVFSVSFIFLGIGGVLLLFIYGFIRDLIQSKKNARSGESSDEDE